MLRFSPVKAKEQNSISFASKADSHSHLLPGIDDGAEGYGRIPHADPASLQELGYKGADHHPL